MTALIFADVAWDGEREDAREGFAPSVGPAVAVPVPAGEGSFFPHAVPEARKAIASIAATLAAPVMFRGSPSMT